MDSKDTVAVAEDTDEAAWPIEASSQGFWDGERFYLRSFPVFYRWWVGSQTTALVRDRAESGNTRGVDWYQSMGRIELWYPLLEHETAQEILVELSSWELKVSVGKDISYVRGKSQGKTIGPLCGELAADVRPKLCWWELVQEPGEPQWIGIFLSKVKHSAWKDLWFDGPLNPHKRQHFGWTAMLEKPPKADIDTLEKLQLGEPEGISQDLCTGVSPERLCTGFDEEEDERTATVLIHLDEETMQTVTSTVPMEELFSADVTHSSLAVSLRNDGLGVLFGALKGQVYPQLTTWQVTSMRRKVNKDWNIRCPAFYNPVLRIQMTKAEDSYGLWGGVFEELQTPSFEPPRERMSWTERVQRALVLSPGAPLREEVKMNRAATTCTAITTAQDTVTQRVNLTLHLDPSLEETASKYRVDLTTFFALKVGDRMLEVCIVADAEFTMVVGELGGEVLPDKTSWEIVKEREPGSEKEHLALKISLVKGGDRGNWSGEVFRKMEKWQVAQRMAEAQKGGALADAPADPALLAAAAAEDGEAE